MPSGARLMKAVLSLTLVVLASSTAAADGGGQGPCDYFFDALNSAPHVTISHTTGRHKSLWDGKPYDGCQVTFVTKEALLKGKGPPPEFRAEEGSELYRLGWRPNEKYMADGPGTSAYGIEKGTTLCLISEDQSAYVDHRGEIVRSETLTVIVQCRAFSPR